MLIIQIPIIVFVGGLLGFFAGLFALLKILAWHYQSKALKLQTSLRRPITIDRSDAWHAVNQLHGRANDDEM